MKHHEKIQAEGHGTEITLQSLRWICCSSRHYGPIFLNDFSSLFVNFQVIGVCGPLPETLSADCALVRFFARVRANMFNENGLQAEGLITKSADVRFVSSVE